MTRRLGLLAVLAGAVCVATLLLLTTGADPVAPGTGTPAPTASPSAGPPPARHAFPVAGRVSYGRTHGLYPATDLFAPCGRRVVAPVGGVVLEVSRVDRFDAAHPAGESKGGRSVSLRGDDGVRHYLSHLLSISGDVRPGARVRAGQPLATVGRTGNSSGVCHLHYALSPVCAGTGDWWVRRGVVYPWPFLDRWRAGRPASPLRAVRAWEAAHGCPSRPPAP
jgi:murein DD-endopeptidase MepM/ murein hydrolase activator NlpD